MPLNILLADDSMTAQNMAKKILSEAGYEVTTVSNGAAALKKIADKTPDLVILDIYMPGYTGLEVCERVKRAAATSGLPVLLSVGKLEPYREQDATAVRADGVIVKPFEATELVTIVTNVILRASGAGIDFAPRTSTPPVVVQPVASETAPPVVVPVDYSAELAMLESHAQDASHEVSYSPATTANAEYVGAPLPPVEKPLAMAVSAAAPAIEVDNSAAFVSPAVEAISSMPFMIEEMLRADDKVPVDDSADHYSGPVLDVSPVEQAGGLDVSVVENVPGLEVSPAEPVTEPQLSAAAAQLPELHVSPDESVNGEDIEVIEIPAPEPGAATQVSEEAEPIEGGADIPPEELTAIDVEAFLREHAAAESELPSTTGATPDSAQAAPSAGAFVQWLRGYDIESPAVVPEASAPPVPSLEDRPAPLMARDDKSVFEIDDEPLFASAANGVVETAPVSTAPVIEEPVAQPAVEKALVAADAKTEAFAELVSEAAPTEPPAAAAQEPAVQAPEPTAQEQEPAVQVPEPVVQLPVTSEPAAQVPVEQVSAEPKFVAQEPAPEPATAAASAAPESDAKPAIAAAAEDFMFSVPMMLEGTAAMNLPEMPNPGAQPGLQPAGGFASDAPAHPAESAGPAAIDEAAVAGAVQRVLDRFKPQIVAEIVREMAKHKH